MRSWLGRWMGAWFYINLGGGDWNCVREWWKHCSVEMWAFLSGFFFSCPTPTLLRFATKLIGLGEATHSELLGTKRVNETAEPTVRSPLPQSSHNEQINFLTGQSRHLIYYAYDAPGQRPPFFFEFWIGGVGPTKWNHETSRPRAFHWCGRKICLWAGVA